MKKIASNNKDTERKDDMDRPKVLLLGSGLIQAYGGESWEGFLNSISRRADWNYNTADCPEPLKAIILTNDHVDKAMQSKCESYFGRSAINEELNGVIHQFLDMGFDDILTTNYSYEIEASVMKNDKLSKNYITSMMRYTSAAERAEGRYLMHTYNLVESDKTQNRVWHIHGEARKPSTTILGHYYYGNILCKIKEIANNKTEAVYLPDTNLRTGAPKSKNWVQSFIDGDIFIVGFGFGLGEFDLWWLLNRKARDKNQTGKVYFYEPAPEGIDARIELMNLIKDGSGKKTVECKSMGYVKSGDSLISKRNENRDYRDFYSDVIEDIRRKMKNETGE